MIMRWGATRNYSESNGFDELLVGSKSSYVANDV